jgi:tripartite-type tricarboxylate transporter receptor subunit TctC
MTTRVRSELMPEVPTMAETTLPNYDMPAWQSMMGPPGMNPENVQILNKAVVRAVAATCASA